MRWGLRDSSLGSVTKLPGSSSPAASAYTATAEDSGSACCDNTLPQQAPWSGAAAAHCWVLSARVRACSLTCSDCPILDRTTGYHISCCTRQRASAPGVTPPVCCRLWLCCLALGQRGAKAAQSPPTQNKTKSFSLAITTTSD